MNHINLQDIRKNAANQIIAPLSLFFQLMGVIVIAVLSILANFKKIDLTTTIWPVILLGTVVCGFLIITPIVYLFARNSKKLQIKYIKDVIDSKYTYAKFLRSCSGAFSKKLHLVMEENFSKTTEIFSKSIEDTENQYSVIEKTIKEKLDQDLQKTKKLINETNDNDDKEQLKEIYRDYKQKILEHLKNIKDLFDSKKEVTLDEFQEKINLFIDSRDNVIIKNTEKNEILAREQESIAKAWEDFLRQNYN